jgi:hypothetical protein
MTRPSSLSTEAWLLRGVSSLPGTLALGGRRLLFTARGAGTCWGWQLRRLERETGRAGLTSRLEAGATALVFDVPLSDVQNVRFPWYTFSGGVTLTIRGVRYRVGFDEPSNTKMAGEGGDLLGEWGRARRRGRAWKDVLLPSSEDR